MDWIAEDISIWDREELAAAIFEYRDVFSRGSEDMGQTDLVTHSIYTGEHHLIELPVSHPSNFPSLKKLRSRKFWTEASPSHGRAAEQALLFWLLRKMAQPGFAWTIW